MAKEPQLESWRNFNQTKSIKNISGRVVKIEKHVSQHTKKFIVKKIHLIKEVRKQIVNWVFVLSLILSAVVLEIIVGQNKIYHLTNDYQETYFEGIVGDIKTLNPIYMTTVAERALERLVFSSLYQNDQYGKIKKNLAKSLVISSNETNYRITLRDDFKWSDGKNVTAEDVVFSVGMFKNQPESYIGQSLRGVRVKEISPYTVEFQLRSSYAPFLSILDFAILPKHILSNSQKNDSVLNDFNVRPIGSGPFQIIDINLSSDLDKNNKKVSLIKNPYYYQQNGLEKIEFNSYTDKNALLGVIEKGSVNAAVFRNATNYQTKINIKEKDYLINNGVFAFFNNDREIMKNKKMRLAIANLIDKNTIKKEYNDKIKTDLEYPIMNSYFQNNNLHTINKLDKETIKKIFLEFGFELKNDIWRKEKDLTIKLVTVKDTHYQFAAEIIANDFRKFGIKVNLIILDPTEYKKKFNSVIFEKKDYDILVYELELGSDPDVYSFWHSSQSGSYGLNFSNYNSPVADEFLSTARIKIDNELRKAKYVRFVNNWAKDVPAVALYRSYFRYLKRVDEIHSTQSEFNSIVDRYNDAKSWSSSSTLRFRTP